MTSEFFCKFTTKNYFMPPLIRQYLVCLWTPLCIHLQVCQIIFFGLKRQRRQKTKRQWTLVLFSLSIITSHVPGGESHPHSKSHCHQDNQLEVLSLNLQGLETYKVEARCSALFHQSVQQYLTKPWGWVFTLSDFKATLIIYILQPKTKEKN